MKKKKERDLWDDDNFMDISSNSGGGPPSRPPGDLDRKRPNRPARPAEPPARKKKRPASAGSQKAEQRRPRPSRPAPRPPSAISDYDGFEEYGQSRRRAPGGPESRRNPTPPRKPRQPREQARSPQNKRARRLMAAVTILVMAAVTALLCVFLLFKVSEIQITGDRVYEDAEILSLTGYQAGDNLFFLSTKDKEELLKEKLPFIEEVKIIRHIPSTLEIQITGAQVVSCVSSGGSWLYVSGGGKILEKKSEPKPGVMQVTGLTPLDTEAGQSVRVEDENVQNAYRSIMDKLVELGTAEKFTKLDLSDLYDIRLWYEDRVEFKLGSTAELSYKVEFGCSIVSDPEKIGPKDRGTLDLSYADVKRATFAVDTGASSSSPASSSGSSGDNGSSSSSSDGRGGEIPDAPYTGDSGDAGDNMDTGNTEDGSDNGYTDGTEDTGGDEIDYTDGGDTDGGDTDGGGDGLDGLQDGGWEIAGDGE